MCNRISQLSSNILSNGTGRSSSVRWIIDGAVIVTKKERSQQKDEKMRRER